MPTSIDSLQIEINAKSVSANDALDKLILKLDRLTTSLEKVNGSAINGLANSVEKLGKSMQVVNSVKTSDFTRLTRNIEKLSAINTATLNTSASAINILAKSVNSLGNVSQSAQQIGTLASSLSKLGYKSIATATQNIPQLANSLKQLMVTLSTAPKVNSNIVLMTNSLANLAGQLKGVKSTTTTSSTWFGKLSTSMNRATRSSFSLAAAFGKFYATYFLVIRAIKGLWSSVQETADYVESFNYFTVAFGKIAKKWDADWEKYGDENARNYANAFVTEMNNTFSKLSGVKVEFNEDFSRGLLTDTGLKNLGLNIKEITQYASQLASVTNSLGQTGETSLAIADSFTKLAGDISSLFNVDFETVSKNLQSGLIGQSRALYKYGIDITNATLQTYAYELGLEKTVAEMTQMEKQQLRVLAILDQSKVSWGDLANTINSPSNMIRQLTNNLKEAGMVLGQLFMPALEKILPVLNGFSIAIKQLLVDFAGIMGITINFDAFGQGYSELEEELDGLEEGLDDATESANKLKSALRGFDKLNVISTSTSGLSSSLNASFDLTEQIKKATEEYNKQWQEAFDRMENEAQKFAQNIYDKLSPIKDVFTFSFTASGNFGEGLANAFNMLMTSEMFAGIGEKVATALNEVVNNAFSFGETFDFSLAGESIVSEINDFFDTFEFDTLAQTITTFATGLMDFIGSTISGLDVASIENGISEFLTSIDFGELFISSLKLMETLTSLPYEIYNGIKGAIENIDFSQIAQDFMDAFEDEDIGELIVSHINVALNLAGLGFVADFVENLGIDDALEELKNHLSPDNIKAVFDAIPSAIEEAFKNIGNVAIDIFNSFIDFINDRMTIEWDAMYFMGNKVFDAGSFKLFEIPNIPRFATGGFPEDGWFRASKGEYFGSFDDGTSVIANNNQIVSGIANGVRDANSEQNALLREQNALLRQILAKDTSISSRDIFNAVRTEDRNYSLRNGQSAFGY